MSKGNGQGKGRKVPAVTTRSSDTIAWSPLLLAGLCGQYMLIQMDELAGFWMRMYEE